MASLSGFWGSNFPSFAVMWKRFFAPFNFPPLQKLALNLEDHHILRSKIVLSCGWDRDFPVGFFWVAQMGMRNQSQAGRQFWVVRQCFKKDAPLLWGYPWAESESQSLNTLSKGNFSRVLLFDQNGQWLSETPPQKEPFVRLVFDMRDLPFWELPDKRSRTFFSWQGETHSPKKPANVWFATVAERKIATHIEKLLADENSDCSFAWRLLHLNQYQQNAVLFQTRTDDWARCEQIFRAICRLNWPASQTHLSCVVLTLPFWQGCADGYDQLLKWSWRTNSNDEDFEWSTLQRQLLALAWEHFQPARTEKWGDKSTINRIWPEKRTFKMAFVVEEPSFHQQIEELLELQDFVRHHFGDIKMQDLDWPK